MKFDLVSVLISETSGIAGDFAHCSRNKRNDGRVKNVNLIK